MRHHVTFVAGDSDFPLFDLVAAECHKFSCYVLLEVIVALVFVTVLTFV